MPQPTNYTPTTDFSQQEANNASGRSTVNTAALDAEFANIETTLDQTLSNLQLIQRDDGRIGDVTVEVRCLAPDVLNVMGGFNLTGLWTPATAYAVNDICSNGEYTYVCKTAHTSGGSFSATNWVQFGFTSGSDAAQAAANAKESADAALVSENNSSGHASSASASESSAASSAASAASSASFATSSASAASSSATSASNSAYAAAASAASISFPVPVASGGTGATNATGARSALGLGTAATLNVGTGANNVVQLDGTGRLPSVDGSQLTGVSSLPAQAGNSGKFLTTNGTAASWGGVGVLMTPVTASGTAVDFTGIHSWAKRVTVIFNGVSTNGASDLIVRLGTSGGVETTGYVSSLSGANPGSGGTGNTNSTGMLFGIGLSAANTFVGSMTLTNLSGNLWVASVAVGATNIAFGASGGGTKTLSAVLDRVRITSSNGTDTFDAGTVSVLYE